MAIKQKTTVRLQAEAACPSHSLANVQVRDLSFAIDEPTERGGTNLGPTPTDTALAALAGCTNVIGHKCAKALGIDVGQLTINLSCDFDRRGVTLAEDIDVPFVAIEQSVVCSGKASPEDLELLATEVAKYCPLSKLFSQAGTKLNTTWTSA